MPRYTYRCDSCFAVHEITHSMSEKLSVCGECDMESLVRVPSSFTSSTNKEQQSTDDPPGNLVKEFIENTKTEIKTEKDNMAKEMKI